VDKVPLRISYIDPNIILSLGQDLQNFVSYKSSFEFKRNDFENSNDVSAKCQHVSWISFKNAIPHMPDIPNAIETILSVYPALLMDIIIE